MGDLEGQTYLVTGASKGIGRALSLALAEQGVRVLLLSRPSKELNQTTMDVQALSPASIAVPCDMGEPASIEDAAQTILSDHPILHGIVHNAGDVHPIKPLFNAHSDDWTRSMMVNLIGVQHLTQRLGPALQGDHRVRVTTISSGAAMRPLASWSAYCTAKAGLDMWTRCLAEEGAQHNITAVSVAPGIVDTGMQTAIRSAAPEDFPLLDNFVGYHENGDLSDADTVAKALYGLITSHTEGQSGQRFDVRDL
ncbi:MAG: SDR family NAD(P)-dependent oxidoreductase [Candidatus Poseidoniales archaeon]|jgi:benzil reductase ((S)-benzoin forming)